MPRHTVKFQAPKQFPFRKFLKDFFLLVSSVGLLVLSFPKVDWWGFAWIGLVPLFLLLDDKTLRGSLGWGYLFGLMYFFVMVSWLANVDSLTAYFGLPLLVSFLALYSLLFGWGYYYLARVKSFYRIFGLSCLWVVLEYVRAHFLSGFSWASLGLSQYKNLPIIQIADITGMYGVSFLVVMGNCVVKISVEEFLQKRKIAPQTQKILIFFVAGLVGITFYGALRLALAPPSQTVKIAVVQADIPQDLKWNEVFWPEILKKHLLLSRKALAGSDSDLVLWPETAFPGFFGRDEEQMDQVIRAARELSTPLLFGSIVEEAAVEGVMGYGEKYFNSALLLSARGEIIGRYNKIHLVPFGEYLPLRQRLPFLTDVVPIADFTAGSEWTVMNLSVRKNDYGVDVPFSAFICFEDTVPHLVRKFVNRGAAFFVNVTNDAWFGDSKAPYMHLQSSVFRAVENRRSLVRATNTGVSAFIAPNGEIQRILSDATGDETYTSAIGAQAISVDRKKTFYTRFGDVFVLLCAVGLMAAMRGQKN